MFEIITPSKYCLSFSGEFYEIEEGQRDLWLDIARDVRVEMFVGGIELEKTFCITAAPATIAWVLLSRSVREILMVQDPLQCTKSLIY